MDTEYPRMMYAEDGRSMVVSSAEAEGALAGFQREPFAIHQSEGGRQPDTVTGVPTSGHDDLALVVADLVIERLLERFDVTPKDESVPVMDDIARPRRGRPPKNREVQTEVSVSQAAPATTLLPVAEA